MLSARLLLLHPSGGHEWLVLAPTGRDTNEIENNVRPTTLNPHPNLPPNKLTNQMAHG